ncbi:transposase [Photobacterium nomapromontoriensis]
MKFLWLILQHVLPKGLRRVRDYGLLRGHEKERLKQIQTVFMLAGLLALRPHYQQPHHTPKPRAFALAVSIRCIFRGSYGPNKAQRLIRIMATTFNQKEN